MFAALQATVTSAAARDSEPGEKKSRPRSAALQAAAGGAAARDGEPKGETIFVGHGFSRDISTENQTGSSR